MIVLTWGHVVACAIGLACGLALAEAVRTLRRRYLPCRFCNGKGYFRSITHEASVMDQAHSESASFKP